MGGQQPGHRPLDLGLLVFDLHHEMALVTHHTADGKTLGAGQIGDATGVGRQAAAAGHAHVDVDQHFGDAAARRRLDRLGGVDGDGDASVGAGGHRLQATDVEHLVGQQQVFA